MKLTLTLFVSLLFLHACSGTKSSTASFSISTSHLVSGIDPTISSGGAFLIAEDARGLTIGRSLQMSSDNRFDDVFPNGTWNFHLIAWQGGGSGNFTGTVRCGSVKGVSLVGKPVSVDMIVSNANCVDSTFVGSHPYNTSVTYSYKSPQIETCNQFPTSSSFTTATNCEYDPLSTPKKRTKGNATGYQYVLQDFERDPAGNITWRNSPVVSNCLEVDLSPTSSDLTAGGLNVSALNIPNETSFFLGLRLRAFFKNACDPNFGVKDILLAKGTKPETKTQDNYFLQTYDYAAGAGKMLINIDDIDSCQGARASGGDFAGGDGTAGSPYLICSYPQLDTFISQFDTTHFSSHVKLLRDINYWYGLSSIWTPTFPGAGSATSYTATFDGNSKRIIGLNIESSAITNVGFINHLGGAGKIVSTTFTGARVRGDLAAQVGVVAGFSEGLLDDVKVEDSFVSGSRDVGALVGYHKANTLDQPIVNSRVYRTKIEAFTIAGGLAGRVTPSTSVTTLDRNGVYNVSIRLRKELGVHGCHFIAGGTCATGTQGAFYKNTQCALKAVPAPATLSSVGTLTDTVYNVTPINVNKCQTAGYSWDTTELLCLTSPLNPEDCHRVQIGAICLSPSIPESACTPGNNAWVGSEYAGGLVGELETCTNPIAHVSNSTAWTDIHGHARLGGIYGKVGNGCRTLDSYVVTQIKADSKDTAPGPGANSGFFAGKAGTSGIDFINTFAINSTISGEQFINNFGVGLYAGSGTLNDCTGSLVQAPSQTALACASTDTLSAIHSLAAPNAAWIKDAGDYVRLAWEDQRICSGKKAALTGDGSAANPFLICTADQFKNAVTNSAGGLYYALGDNIDFLGLTTVPSSSVPLAGSLKGIFDGRGYTLMNYFVNPSADNIALLGDIAATGVFKNFKLRKFEVSATAQSNLAPLAGLNLGTISNVSASSYIRGVSYLSGLVVHNSGFIEYAEANGLLKAEPHATISGMAGGLVAINSSNSTATGKIYNSRSRTNILLGNISLPFSKIGGVVAQNNGFVKQVSYDGTIKTLPSSTNSRIGGIAGLNSGLIENAHSRFVFLDSSVDPVATSRLANTSYLAGVAGENVTNGILNGVATGTITDTVADMQADFHHQVFYATGRNFQRIANMTSGTLAESFWMDETPSRILITNWGTNGSLILPGFTSANFPGLDINTSQQSPSSWILPSSGGPQIRQQDSTHRDSADLFSKLNK